MPGPTIPTDQEAEKTPGPSVTNARGPLSALDEPLADRPIPLSAHAQQVAAVLGLHPLLARIVDLQAQVAERAPGADRRLLAARQELSDRYLQIMFEVSEVVAELECEKARAEELAVRLEEVENDIRNRRTVIAVISEPVFHIMAASALVFGMPIVTGALEVVGNGIRLGYGLAADRVAQHEDMSHALNLLTEVWQGGTDSTLFPPPVWRFLNQPIKEGESMTRREMIISIWRRHVGAAGSKTESRRLGLYFGDGGRYGVQDLRHRSDMMGVLSAFVMLMIHDLNVLSNETLHEEYQWQTASRK